LTLGKIQSSNKNLARSTWPLEKIKGIYSLTKYFLLQENKAVGTIIEDKILCYYRKSTTFSKARIMASTFGYFRRKQIPIILSF